MQKVSQIGEDSIVTHADAIEHNRLIFVNQLTPATFYFNFPTSLRMQESLKAIWDFIV